MNSTRLLTLTIEDQSALYQAYMPFVRNGGLFVPVGRRYELGDEVSVALNLMGVEEPTPVTGKVIWVTPKRAQGKRAAGIGVQFSDQDQGKHRQRIERHLAGLLGGEEPTHTL